MFLIVFLIVVLILTGFFFFSSVCLQLYKNKYLERINEDKLSKHKRILFICTYLISFATLLMTLTFENLIIILPIYIFIIILLLLLSICKFMKKDFLLYFLCGTIIAISMILFNIISFAMVFNECSYSNSGMDGAIQEFNNKFTQYEGNNIKGSIVNTMLSEVISNNKEQDAVSRQVEVVFSDSLNMKPLLQNDTTFTKVDAEESYEITCKISKEKNDKGLVYCILVTKKGDSKPQPIHTDEYN